MPELEVKCYIWGRPAHCRCKTWNILLSYINIREVFSESTDTSIRFLRPTRYLRAGRGVRPNKSPTDTRLIATSVSAAFPRNLSIFLRVLNCPRSIECAPAGLFTCAHIKTLCAGWQQNTPRLALSSNGHLYARDTWKLVPLWFQLGGKLCLGPTVASWGPGIVVGQRWKGDTGWRWEFQNPALITQKSVHQCIWFLIKFISFFLQTSMDW